MKIILPKDDEDTALLLGGKKKKFNKGYFDRFGLTLKLNEKQINAVYRKLKPWLPKAITLIDDSFLNDERKSIYKAFITQRTNLFFEIIWSAIGEFYLKYSFQVINSNCYSLDQNKWYSLRRNTKVKTHKKNAPKTMKAKEAFTSFQLALH